jgi:enoyl-CoA hydratase/carnithine racemase
MNHIPSPLHRIPVSEEVSLKSIGNDIFEIWLQRPERMNALGVATCAAVSQAVCDAARKHARVVLLRGTGCAFCSGADLKERKGMDLAARLGHNAAIRAAIDAIASARFVSIAVLNGVAVGGGLELALGCDLRFAAAGVTLGLTESRVGAFPGAGGTQRLPR